MTNVSTLTSLAMLKVHQDVDGSDYLDYLVPFVTYCLGRAGQQSPFRLQEEIVREFGLHIPQRVIELVLGRLSRRRMVSREAGSYRLIAAVSANGFDQKRVRAQRRLQVVVNALINFVSQSGVAWTPEQAMDAVVAYLSRYSIDCLRAYCEGSALPTVQSGGKSDLYHVNAFIHDAHLRSTQMFEDIILLVESQMLVNGLLCPDLQWTKQKFSGVTFYLDTPLILPLLGAEGPEREAAVREMVDLVRNLRGKIAIFDHTAEEVDYVLARCERHFSDPRARSRLIADFRRVGKNASDIALLRAELSDRYRDLKIDVREAPKNLVQFQIDEVALEDAIREEIDYSNEYALRYDIKSIRSIYTLRKGRAPHRIEDANAILVTSNVSLARVAYHFGREHESLREVSAVIGDMTLANIAWLKAPLGAPNLPRLEVLSACHAALQPKEPLLDRFVREINRLRAVGRITPQQHEYLRLSPRVREELMRLTFGDEKRVTIRTVVEVIEATESAIAQRERNAMHGEQEKLNNELQRMSAAVRDANATATAARVRSDQREAEVRKRLYWWASGFGRVSGIAVFGLMAILGLVSLVKADALEAKFGLAISLAIVVIAMILDQLGKIAGFSALQIGKWVERRITKWLFDALVVAFLPPTDEVAQEDLPETSTAVIKREVA
jgi:hypothetical protein